MVVVYGTRYFGKVDHMDDGSYVATKFFHVMFIPLIPLSSFWITGEEGDTYRGFSIPMSGKSVLTAYARAVMMSLAIAIPIMTALIIAGRTDELAFDFVSPENPYYNIFQVLIPVGVATLLCGGLILLHILMRSWLSASTERREELVHIVESRTS